MAYFQFVLICLFFGTNFFMMDRANRWFGPIEVATGRLLGGAAFLAIVWLLIERKKRLRWANFRDIIIAAFIAFSCPYLLQPALIGQGYGHSFFGTTVAFTPLLTMLVSIPLLGVRPSKRQLVGVLLGLGFVTLLLADGNLRGIPTWILALAFLIPVLYAVGNTWIGRTLSDADSTPMCCAMMSIGALMLVPFLASSQAQNALGIAPPAERTDFAIALFALLWLGVVGTGLCAWMFIRLIQSKGPLFPVMVTYVVPVVAMAWGLSDGEKTTTLQMIAIAGIFSMVAMVQVPQKKDSSEVLSNSGEDTSLKQETDPQPLPAEL